MKLCSYKDCFNDFIALAGLEGAPDALVKTRFNAWFNLRLREIWRAHRWSFLIKTLPVFVCKHHWVDLPREVETGDVFEIFSSDFRVDKNAKRVRFYLEGGESAICGELPPARLALPPFDAAKTYEPGDAYQKGKDAFYVGESEVIKLTGNVYSQNFLASAAQGNSALEKGDIVVLAEGIFYSAGVWNGADFEQFSTEFFDHQGVVRYKAINGEYSADFPDKTLPYAFKSFIAEATRANWLSAENRPEEAQAAEARAQAFLEDEIYRDSCNPYSSTPVNFR